MSDWSDIRIAMLKRLWLEGLSASQIAKQVGGVTRNAVIGKIHRLGLSGRGAPSKPGRAPKIVRPRTRRRAPSALRVTVASVLPAPQAAVVPDEPGLVSTLAQLGAHACKWPIGDPKAAGFSFCGRLANGPYCPAHKAQAFRPGSAWRADRDPVVRRALAGLA